MEHLDCPTFRPCGIVLEGEERAQQHPFGPRMDHTGSVEVGPSYMGYSTITPLAILSITWIS